MEAWAYIERERGSEPNKQYFVEHYKLQEIPVIFIRDKVGAEGIGQNPKEDTHTTQADVSQIAIKSSGDVSNSKEQENSNTAQEIYLHGEPPVYLIVKK